VIIFSLLGLPKMQKLTMQEACKNFPWPNSWAENLSYDDAKKELTIELEWREFSEDDELAFLLAFFDGDKGTIIFHGVSDFQMKPMLPSENTLLKFILKGYSLSETKKALYLEGYTYKDTQRESDDRFTLSFFADSATWHSKTKNE
jgi:hypothetical protein